ncbi:MAG: acyltransferase family protein [Gaiellaceae bacterium]
MAARIRSVEGARGVAAIGVLVYHTAGASDSGRWLATATSRLWLGVPLFFVLSGFLLFRPFARSIVRDTAWPSLRRYGRARVLRIFPAYWTVLIVMVAVQGLFLTGPALAALAVVAWVDVWARGARIILAPIVTTLALFALADTSWESIWAGMTNFLLIQVPLGPYQMLGPAWTLCIEISFYAALPVLAYMATRFASRGIGTRARAARAAAVIALLIPTGLGYAAFAGDSGFTPGLMRPLPICLPGFLDEFAAGMLLAIALEVWPSVSPPVSRLLLAAGVGTAVIANVFLFSVGPLVVGGGRLFFGKTMAVAFALVLASVLTRGGSTLVGRLLSSRPMVAAGTVSYGIYLWHGFAIGQLEQRSFWGWAPLDVFATAAVTVLAATLSWFLIERRALALKSKSRSVRARRAGRVPPIHSSPAPASAAAPPT